MATGGRITKSVIKESDAIHDFPCFPCSENSKNTEALYQCADCVKFYCQRCLDSHNECVKNHTIHDVDVKATESEQSRKHQSASLPMDTCEDHHGKIIEMYCEQHDEVCCAVCIAMNHRLCKGVDYIPNITKTLLNDQDRQNVKSSLEEVKRALLDLMSKQSEFLEELKQQRNEMINGIQQFKANFVKRVDALEKSSISDVEKNYKTIADDINHDIEKVDKILQDVEILFSKSNQSSCADAAKLFVNMKLEERQVSIADDFKTEILGKPLERIDYECNTSIENFLKDVESMITLKVSRQTLTPFVNILVPCPGDIVESFTSSLRSDLLGVGIHSKFINSSEINADVYTVVAVSDLNELYRLRFKRVHHCKIILFRLVNAKRRPLVGELNDMMKQRILAVNILLDVKNFAKTISIPFVYSETENYIYKRSDIAHALMLVLEIMAQNSYVCMSSEIR